MDYIVEQSLEEKALLERWATEQAERAAAEEARIAAKETAKAKLTKLGLTEEEVAALIA